MSKVITFSRVFPAHHPRSGESTNFVEKILDSIKYGWFVNYYEWLRENNPKLTRDDIMKFIDTIEGIHPHPKHHTIRQGRRWKEGMKFSPRVWSGKPYQSKQIIIAPDIEIVKTWDVRIECSGPDVCVLLPTEIHSQFELLSSAEVAKNDGLNFVDFRDWFNNNGKPSEVEGQIICWNKSVNY